MLNSVGEGKGQENSDKAEDALQKEVDPLLRVAASQGNGPPARRLRPP
jgi:hypothetical protein